MPRVAAPEAAVDPEPMLVTVARYFDPWEAHVVCARLQAEDIPATVAGDQHMISNWPLSIALGGAMVQVPGHFLERAQRVVADYNSGILEKDLVEEFPDSLETCPACGSNDVAGSVPLTKRALAVVTTLVASAPFPTRATSMLCQECGHQWRLGEHAARRTAPP